MLLLLSDPLIRPGPPRIVLLLYGDDVPSYSQIPPRLKVRGLSRIGTAGGGHLGAHLTVSPTMPGVHICY